MLCPLKFQSQNTGNYNCDTVVCAIWNEEYECCSIKAVSKYLRNISKKINNE